MTPYLALALYVLLAALLLGGLATIERTET